ncbi:molybdopterin-guanine dinucleotide biosynthesis protein B [Ahrensia kielensis]|uniref:Molybdopterin-guanine dinucleotide biosynthesis protein B n=1 Tax=Ahrensia kielensis TaxID=76980 RepID=A0ABU9T546_9HYPH
MTKPLFGISGFKNSGKTTLTASLIAEFTSRELSVSSVKHAHHEFDLDQPGTDTDKHRSSGAKEVVISSAKRWALMHEISADEDEPNLQTLITHMADADLILAEGFKSEEHPKVLLIASDEQAKLMGRINNVVAIAAEPNIEIDSDLPRFERNDIKQIADFIAQHLNLEPRS